MYWNRGNLSHHGAFKQATLKIIADCTTAFRAGDRAAMDKLLTILDEAAPQATAEPFLSTHEYTSCVVALLIGIDLARCGEFEHASLIAFYVHAIQLRGDARRKALGLGHLRHTEVKYMLLNLLGDLKAQASIEYRDAVYSPRQMCTEWQAAAERALAYSAANHAPRRAEDIRRHVGWAGVQVIKTAQRFLVPSEVVALIAKFNKMFGAHLAATPLHFRDNPPVADHPWYWSFEICKGALSGELTREEVDELYYRKALAEDLMYAGESYDFTSYNEAAEREARTIKARCKLEVLESPATTGRASSG